MWKVNSDKDSKFPRQLMVYLLITDLDYKQMFKKNNVIFINGYLFTIN